MYIYKMGLNCSRLSMFPFQNIDKEWIYCRNKLAYIQQVLLECRTKSLRDARIKTMNDKCREFRLAENAETQIWCTKLKFDVQNNVNVIDRFISRAVAFVYGTYMHVHTIENDLLILLMYQPQILPLYRMCNVYRYVTAFEYVCFSHDDQ